MYVGQLAALGDPRPVLVRSVTVAQYNLLSKRICIYTQIINGSNYLPKAEHFQHKHSVSDMLCFYTKCPLATIRANMELV
jgi:hypothetical protein